MAEANLYITVKVACEEDLVEQIGRNIYFDLVDHNKVRSFCIKRQTPLNLFKEEVAKEFGIPVQFQRFWLWARRQNNTYRPHQQLTPQQEAEPVGHLREPAQKVNAAELNLFLEVELGRDLRPIRPPVQSADNILLFFKLYDPLKEELRYVGRFYVRAGGMPVDILAKINWLAGFAPDEEIELYEEIISEEIVMIVPVDKLVTFRCSELEDGDIICFQKSPQVGSTSQCEHPDVGSFLEYVHHHQVLNEPLQCDSTSLGTFMGQQVGRGRVRGRGRGRGLSGARGRVWSRGRGRGWSSVRNGNLFEIKPEHHSEHGCCINSEPEPTESSQGAISGGSTSQTHSANAPAGKVKFLAYWVSSEASLLLEKIHNIHKDTFTKFSMKGEKLQTVLLESFASFVESMSTTKVNEVQGDVLRRATVSIEDFEQVGLELSWLKKRLEEAKKVNKCAESVIYVDLCEAALKVGRAKVRELEEGLAKAKAELEDWSTDLPNSLAVNDYLLMDVV